MTCLLVKWSVWCTLLSISLVFPRAVSTLSVGAGAEAGCPREPRGQPDWKVLRQWVLWSFAADISIRGCWIPRAAFATPETFHGLQAVSTGLQFLSSSAPPSASSEPKWCSRLEGRLARCGREAGHVPRAHALGGRTLVCREAASHGLAA